MASGQFQMSHEAGSPEPTSETRIRYPLILPAGRWRRALKVILGRAAVVARPRRAQHLLDNGDPMNFGRIDRLIVAGLVSRAQTAEDWTALSRIQQRFWAGQGGAIFNSAPEIEQRFYDVFLRKHTQPLEVLRRKLAAGHQRCEALCEIGSGNGLALEYLSQKMTTIPRFVGLDINAEATHRNAARWRDDPKLEFVNGDALDWISRHARPRWAYFSNAGVLEYFSQEKVSRLYRYTATLGPAWWVVTEPIYDGYDLATETESRVNGAEFSFCHNHPHLLREAGWEVLDERIIEETGLRWLMVCARVS